MPSKQRQRPPQYGLRLSPARREAWDKAATRNGLTLSVFIMSTVDRRARFDGGLEQFAGPRLAEELAAAEELSELAAPSPSPAPEPQECQHPHESRERLAWGGVRCAPEAGGCGELL
jgi:hypothetical protein